MYNFVKNEKIVLITIFILFSALSTGLIFIMIKKDLKTEESSKQWINEPVVSKKPENNWPKVEIQTSK